MVAPSWCFGVNPICFGCSLHPGSDQKAGFPLPFLGFACRISGCMLPMEVVTGKRFAIVIMGVSGAGKSTIARALADDLHCSFVEADDFHSERNKEKMRKGIPLLDEDRMPWLEELSHVTMKFIDADKPVVLACSALKRKYREILRKADVKYKMCEDHPDCRVRFVCLEARMELIADRMQRRQAEGDHFMPVTLLKSQFDLLQKDDEEGITTMDGSLSPQAIIRNIKEQLNIRADMS